MGNWGGGGTGTVAPTNSWRTWAGGMVKRYGPTLIKAAGAATATYLATQQSRVPSPKRESDDAKRRAQEAFRRREGMRSGFDRAMIGRRGAGMVGATQLGHPTLIGGGQT